MKLISAPIFKDDTTGKASVTLTFCYLLFWPAFISNVIMLYQPNANTLTAWSACQVSFFLSCFLYRIRQIDKVKASINGNSIEFGKSDPAK